MYQLFEKLQSVEWLFRWRVYISLLGTYYPGILVVLKEIDLCVDDDADIFYL
jgi:hypothetical protein